MLSPSLGADQSARALPVFSFSMMSARELKKESEQVVLFLLCALNDVSLLNLCAVCSCGFLSLQNFVDRERLGA